MVACGDFGRDYGGENGSQQRPLLDPGGRVGKVLKEGAPVRLAGGSCANAGWSGATGQRGTAASKEQGSAARGRGRDCQVGPAWQRARVSGDERQAGLRGAQSWAALA